jgi:hypothetical protein
MHSLCARASALALVVFGLAGGCGDDEVVPDVDGSPEDAGDASTGPDAENLCPGEVTFEGLVADAISGQATFEVEVAVEGGSATTSAPNGRAQLCLPADADSSLLSTKTEYLSRLDTTSRDALAAANAAAQPYPLEVLSVAAADALLDDLGATRDPADSVILVSVRSYPDGAALEGATISIDVDGNDGAFARDAVGEFAASLEAAVAAGGTVLFANVPLTGGAEEGRAAITVTPPDGFSGTCAGPPSVELQADGVSGAFFACQ